VVAWAHGTTGIADACAPSQNREVFWPEARQAVLALLRKGYTVAAPDYPGLGTAGPHPYLVGDSEARSIIDSVRAARYLDGSLSKSYAVDGHSQGGQGALFTGELAPIYDGDLTLKTVVAIAPASNFRTLAELIPGTAGQGYLVMGVFGLAAVDPTVRPAELFAPPAKEAARMGKLQNACLYEVLEAFDDLTAPDKDEFTDPADLLVGGALPAAVVDKLVATGDPARRPSSAPILVIQGEYDEAVPAFITDMLVEQLEQRGNAPVTYELVPGETHDGAVFATTERVATWIETKLG
jgi:pimeloyl-ACP methyl ester carboxylesterase